MKALLLILMASLLAGGVAATSATEPPAPDLPWYYSSPCQQPEGVSLHDWLARLPVRQVEIGGWDCSQASAYIEWLAENCGHSAVIACACHTAKPTHCWVVVEGHPYESTGMHWVDTVSANTERYDTTLELADIHAAWRFGDGANWNNTTEWGWWVTYPELRT